MSRIRGGITAAKGFRAFGLYCGIKKSKKRDLMLLASDVPCRAAGTFTTNRVKASCVKFNMRQLRNKEAQAVLVNSGNANCLTGPSGSRHTRLMAVKVAEALGLRKGDVLVASTGVIGKKLPVQKILKAIPELVRNLDSSARAGQEAAHAILTTDKVIKEDARLLMVGGKRVRIGAAAKGSGMLHPFMNADGSGHATMLCFITTDAEISDGAMRNMLDSAVHRSFNRISVDGDQSTNDMVIFLANGRAHNMAVKESTPEYRRMSQALTAICVKMAKEMVKDAEGATKFVEIRVRRAKTRDEARTVGMSVATSTLVKTALFGSDPNWGRIAASVGYADAAVDPARISIHLGPYCVLNGDRAVKQSIGDLNAVFRKKNIKITIDLNSGQKEATVWTSDLSSQYVRFNSEYTT